MGHQQPCGVAGAERQEEHRNATVPAPVRSLAWPLSCLGCPGEPQEAAWGLSPVGGWCWRSPGPSACLFPCAWPAQLPGPGHVASRKAAKLKEGTPTPSLELWARVVSPVCCPAPGSCSFLCPDDVNQGSPVPRPAGWTARFPRPVGSEGPAGLRPPERGGFIHNLVEYFQCYPGLGPAGAGEAVSGPLATVSLLPMQGLGEKPPRRRPAPSIPRGRCFA